MSRLFTVTFRDVAVTAAQDFFEVLPAANKPCKFIRLKLSQSSDVGDAAEEILRVSIIRVPATATSGSGGTASAENLVDATGAAAGFASETNNTTVATTSGTLEILDSGIDFNIRTGIDVPLTARGEYEFVNGTLGVVRLAAAPTDSLTISGTLEVEEAG